ncbi:MAG TPA: anti-sigma regulatory factor [Blastocatellia bacterium]|nr:anti-sigma regulatory factor [Blastocatellia bacterium]
MHDRDATHIAIEDNKDIIRVRASVREAALEMGFKHIDQVRLVTAASELARNIRLYAGRGRVEIRCIRQNECSGLQVKFEDEGPGIADIALAMTDGYSTSRGLGKGLPGARRLVDEFEIESDAGIGTRVIIRKWL